MRLEDRLLQMASASRLAARVLKTAAAEQRSIAIRAMAAHIRDSETEILAANRLDVEEASAHKDRLLLNSERLAAMAASVESIAELPDPIGQEMARWSRPNGLDLARVRTPIGVIGMIYESRPNVTADAAAICLRSANSVLLRCGSEALGSSLAIHRAIGRGLADGGLPQAAVQLVDTSDREAVGLLLSGLDRSIDLIIPRGGKALVERVEREARVPTLGHLEGVCHTYVHEGADVAKALTIVRNAKMRRVSVCGATETLLVDHAIAPAFLPKLAAALPDCELRGCAEAMALTPMTAATKADWGREFLAPILAVRLVAGVDEAVAHIERFGTGHTEAIITEDAGAAELFLDSVDSAIVIWNASTQFADGGEFGFGAEIGIATGKLHARGPVGPEQLTTYNYRIRGDGQIRP